MAQVRPLTRCARQQNDAFLAVLRRTGNAREAARAVGVGRATFTRRRAKHPAFAAAWDAALAVAGADARLGCRGPIGAAPRIITLPSGQRQLRRAVPGRLDGSARQRFLLALAASANIRLAAAAAGFSHSAFYRLRERDPAFAREMRDALTQGYERLEGALLESWLPGAGEDAAWRANELPALPPMTPAQALQLLHLHHRQVRWREAVFARHLLPGETGDLRSARMARLYRAKLTADAEETLACEAERTARRCERPAPPVPPPIALPDLSQVKGWSQADPSAATYGPRALFGGWTTDMLSDEQRERGLRRARRKGDAGGDEE